MTKDIADGINAGEEVALTDGETGEILAVMHVREKYSIDKTLEAEHVYRTTDPKHPGVAKVLSQGDVNLAGSVWVLGEGDYAAHIRSSISGPRNRARCSSNGAGRRSPPSRPAIRCTAATNIW